MDSLRQQGEAGLGNTGTTNEATIRAIALNKNSSAGSRGSDLGPTTTAITITIFCSCQACYLPFRLAHTSAS